MKQTSQRDDLIACVIRVRIAQQMINEELKQKSFRVPVHLALGHEAIAAAAAQAMMEGDAICLTHRNIHYNLALADSFRKEIDELRLQPNGIGGGQLGSMNMDNPAKGAIYTSSVLGNNLCVAAGAALGSKLLGLDEVVFVSSGDGAMEEGAFYESLELAKSQRAPLIILVENNGWSLGTRIEERRCPIDLESLASAFEIPYLRLEGNDPLGYLDELQKLRSQVVEISSPALVEIMLTTLGSWNMNAEGNPVGKFINYHHGASPSVELSNSPFIAKDETDPVFVLKELLGESKIEKLAGEIREKLEAELQ